MSEIVRWILTKFNHVPGKFSEQSKNASICCFFRKNTFSCFFQSSLLAQISLGIHKIGVDARIEGTSGELKAWVIQRLE